MQWRELRAIVGRASGSTLRRRLDDWSAVALLRRVHAVLVRMVRAGPEAAPWDVVVDSCSVRAKHGGELTGPNPTDRGKAGTKYHVVVATDGIPLGAIPSAANVHDTRLFPHLLHLAQAVCAAIGRLYADAGYDSADNRALCLRHGIQPRIRKIGATHGSRLGRIRCVVEHDCAWVAGQQKTGPAPGQARPRHTGPPDCCLHLHRRQPHQWLLKTVPKPPEVGRSRLSRLKWNHADCTL